LAEARNVVNHRRQLLNQATLYLFTYDVETSMDRELLGFVPGGTRVTFSARPNLAPVYHLYRSRTIAGLGYNAISGTLTTGADSLRWREDDVEKSDIHATIVTQDGATIHMTYMVITDLGAGGYRRLVANKKPDRVGTADLPIDFPVITGPRFETSDGRYDWINNYQCVGHGRVEIIQSEIRRLSYDVYAMT
jgi:hypothetical protein